MKSLRIVVPALCVVGLFACNRDRATMDVDRDRTGRVDVPGTALDRDRPGLNDRDRAGVDMRHDDGVGTTTVTGANVGSVQNASAIERIVAARCEREATCNNVGSDKRFSNRDVCTREIKADMKDDLDAKDCPSGVDQKELDECLAAIRKESCGNPIDTIGRLAACRTSDMCLKTGAPNH